MDQAYVGAARPIASAPGKGAADENFPVASRLLGAAARPVVMRFYRFARAADDIADTAALDPEQKLALLDVAERGLRGEAIDESIRVARYAAALRQSLQAAGVSVLHACRLLQAFRQDATRRRYGEWGDLLLYCSVSAAPVGRFLIELHKEDACAGPAADALCSAHQILNQVQDCRDDYLRLDRVYLPQGWLAEAGAREEELAASHASPPLRAALDRMLDGAAGLLAAAEPLPRLVADRRLRIQAATTLALGRGLLRALRRRDPLHHRVRLSPSRKLGYAVLGLANGLRP